MLRITSKIKIMLELESYLPDLISSLIGLDPVKIIVFGSYVNGDLHEDSDLDLLIVLNKNYIPKTYEEKMELKAAVRKTIRKINQKVPIDLLVYTIPEYNEIIKDMGSFLKEIHQTGKIIYEKAS